MKKSKFLLGTIASILAFSIFSCSEGNLAEEINSNEVKKSVDSDNLTTDHSVEIDTINNDYEFMPPSPIQIASILKKVNMPYEDGLTNPTENADIAAKILINDIKRCKEGNQFACARNLARHTNY